MKKIYSIALFLLMGTVLLAQSPQAVNYQAVLRDAQGNLIKSKSVSIRLSVLEGSATGSAAYVESHSVSTNELGMINLQLGNGSTTDDFSAILWGADAHYLKVELDETGGSTYKNLGTTQLVAVPYALFSDAAGKANSALIADKATIATNVENADQDSTNELQTLSLTGNQLTLSDNGGSVTLPTGGGGGSDFDQDSTNELQTITLTGKVITLSDNGGSITLNTDDADADATNEIQRLSLTGSDLTLSRSGGTVTIPTANWTKTGDTLFYNRYAKIGGSNVAFGPRLVIGATSGPTSRIGLYTRASGGTLSNFGVESEVRAGVAGTANNAAFRGYANTGRFAATAFSGIVEGDSIGFGANLGVSTNSVNVGYNATTTSATGTGFIQYGANIFAQGSGSGDHFGIRAVGQGTGTSTAGGSSNYGGLFIAGGTGKNFGIGTMGQTLSQHFINVGVYGVSNGAATTGYNYGVIGTANNADTNYAAYFFGDVTYTGTLATPSDNRLKSNVLPMESTSSLSKIMSLRPVTYTYKQEEYEFMSLPEGQQFGFIAQELGEVFPELVTTQVTPVLEHDEDFDLSLEDGSGINDGNVFRYQGVNYIGLIPILTTGIQEQQAEIDEQQTELDTMQAEIEELKKQNEELRQMVEQLLNNQ